VIEGEFQGTIGASNVGFSNGDFGLGVQSHDDTNGEPLLSGEIVEDELAMIA
jgi:hypothetical protein